MMNDDKTMNNKNNALSITTSMRDSHAKISEYYMNDNFNDVDTYVPHYAYNKNKKEN